MKFVIDVLLFSVSVFVVAGLLPGIRIKSYGTAVVVALVYSLVGFLVGWLLVFLSVPFLVVTFGLFIFVVNAILLWLTDLLIEDFKIDGMFNTLLAAFLITILNSFFQWIFKWIF